MPGSALQVSATLVPARTRASSSRSRYRTMHASQSGRHRTRTLSRLLHMSIDVERSREGPTARMGTVGVHLASCPPATAGYCQKNQLPKARHHQAPYACCPASFPRSLYAAIIALLSCYAMAEIGQSAQKCARRRRHRGITSGSAFAAAPLLSATGAAGSHDFHVVPSNRP
jgi:hypothetical protein